MLRLLLLLLGLAICITPAWQPQPSATCSSLCRVQNEAPQCLALTHQDPNYLITEFQCRRNTLSQVPVSILGWLKNQPLGPPLSSPRTAAVKNGAACCRRRIELVQDLEFPEACHRIKATSDGKFLFATGIHPPRLRCYELSELSMKFERHFDSEVVDFQVRVVGIRVHQARTRVILKVADPVCQAQQVIVVPLFSQHAAGPVLPC